ncbi:hypothetical protein [Sphingobacterium siyangense]|uniref:hypothetical protein n=1 Tax=Sphingobacterium siyangense TaxID=459529 RepID=UPI002FD95182
MNNEELISSTIFWKKHPEIGYYYYNEEYDKLILLRMNNFPEEPLFTLINGLTSQIWKINRLDGIWKGINPSIIMES